MMDAVEAGMAMCLRIRVVTRVNARLFKAVESFKRGVFLWAKEALHMTDGLLCDLKDTHSDRVLSCAFAGCRKHDIGSFI